MGGMGGGGGGMSGMGTFCFAFSVRKCHPQFVVLQRVVGCVGEVWCHATTSYHVIWFCGVHISVAGCSILPDTIVALA